MSYRNPRQVIDTQSGQHFIDLQRSLSGTFSKISTDYSKKQEKLIKEAKSNKEKNETRIRVNQEKEDNVLGRLEKERVNNPEINFDEAAKIVDTYSDIKNSIDLGNITDPSELLKARKLLAQIESMPNALSTTFEGFGALNTTFEESFNKAGKQGGYDLLNTPPETLSHLNVFNNRAKGVRQMKVQQNPETGVVEYGIFLKSNDEDDKGKFYTEIELDNVLAGNSNGIIVIPDETTNMETMQSIIVGETPGTGKKSIKNEFLVDSGKIPNADGTYTVSKVIDQEKVRTALQSTVKANVSALLSSASSLKSFYDNVLNPLNDKEQYTASEIRDNIDSNGAPVIDKIEKAYLDKFMNQYNFESVKKDAVTIREKSREEDKKGSKGEDVKPLTQTELNRQRKVEDINYIAKKLKEKDYKFESKAITKLASSFGVTYGQNVEDEDGKLYGITLKVGDRKLTILDTDKKEQVIEKILRLKVPGLTEKEYTDVINGLKSAKDKDLPKDGDLIGFAEDAGWLKKETSENKGDNKLSASRFNTTK